MISCILNNTNIYTITFLLQRKYHTKIYFCTHSSCQLSLVWVEISFCVISFTETFCAINLSNNFCVIRRIIFYDKKKKERRTVINWWEKMNQRETFLLRSIISLRFLSFIYLFFTILNLFTSFSSLFIKIFNW